MELKLFHGTTFNRFLKAIKEGYLGTSNTIWDCSEPNTTYFYGEDNLRLEDCHSWFFEGIRNSLESASLSLSTERQNLRRVVLVLDSEALQKLEEHGYGHFSVDSSCANSTDTYQFKGRIPIELIEEIWIDKEDLDILSLFFIGMAHYKVDRINRRIYNILGYDYNLSKEVLEASEELYHKLVDYYFDNYFDTELLEKLTLKKFKERFLK